jgi:hypothetical protein
MTLIPLPQINIADLDAIPVANAEGRKNFVGNAIYPNILSRFGEQLAGRITGMLIDEKLVNFTQLLTNPHFFTTKCYEAQQLLLTAMQQAQVQVPATASQQ